MEGTWPYDNYDYPGTYVGAPNNCNALFMQQTTKY